MLTSFNYSGGNKTAASTPTKNATPPTGGGLTPFQYQPYTPPPVPAPAPGLLTRAVTAVKGYAQASADLVPTFGDKVIQTVTHPIQSTVDFGNFVSKPAKEALIGTGNAAKGIFTDKGAAKKIADTADLISQVASLGFSPITGAFDVASTIPGAKQAADALNLPFQALGKAGSWVGGGVIDHLPFLSQESRDILKAPFEQLGALAAQVAFGGKVMDKIGILSKRGIEITPEVAKTIVNETKTESPTLNPEVKGDLTPFDYSKTTESTTKQTVAAPTETMIPTGQPSPATEPVSSIVESNPIIPPTETVPSEVSPSGIPGPEGGTPSGLAKSIETKAIDAGLTEGYDKIAGYEGSTIERQKQLFNEDFSTHGIEGLRDLLTGKRELPGDLRASSIIDSAEKYLKKNPTSDMAYELANSPLVSKVSQAGSELGLLQNREQDSYTAKTQDIRKAREARAGETAIKKAKSIPKEAKKAMNEISLSSEDLGKLSDFIDKIVC